MKKVKSYSTTPIETFYNGYRFRSRLEARWAVFFDAIGIEYEYEPEGFELEDGTRYLPDFYFPKYDWYGEVKAPKDGAYTELERASRFVGKGINVLLLFGNIPPKSNCSVWHYSAMHYDHLSFRLKIQRCFIFVNTREKPKGYFEGDFAVDKQYQQYLHGENDAKAILAPIDDITMHEKGGSPFPFCEGFHEEMVVLSKAYNKARQARFEWGEKG